MQITRTNLVFFSPTGTSKKIALAIADGIGLVTRAYDVTKLSQAPAIPRFSGEDLVVLAAPVYAGRLPPVTLDLYAMLSGSGTACVVVGVYGNRHYDDCLVEMEDIMTSHGFRVVAGAAFIGEHSFSRTLGGGRPNAQDLEIAKEFGAAVRDKLTYSDSALEQGAIPGNRPYRDGMTAGGICPEYQAHCTGCGTCVVNCPTGAIRSIGEIDGTQCIRCCACIKGCPEEAILFTQEKMRASKAYLEETFMLPKQPLLIL